jgi:hypothetical protein
MSAGCRAAVQLTFTGIMLDLDLSTPVQLCIMVAKCATSLSPSHSGSVDMAEVGQY